MTQITYRQAVIRALAEEMDRDNRVLLFGEDVGAAGGVFKATEGLLERFGSERVRDTPISEQAIVGAAIGAAMKGLRPVVEIMFADFAGVAFDQIANQMAKYRYLSGGQVTLPLLVRLANGAGAGFGAQHSQSTENWLLNIPGLRLGVPATPADVLGMIKTSIRCDDPVLIFEHKRLYNMKGEVPQTEHLVPIGAAAITREGRDLTVVATQLVLHQALQAAAELEQAGISAEVVDLRWVAPLDVETVSASVSKTGRLLIVQECPLTGSWGATLVARLVAERFETLRAAPALVSAPETPIPFSREGWWIPSADRIVSAARTLVDSHAS